MSRDVTVDFIGINEMHAINVVLHLINAYNLIYVKTDSCDPIFGANYYSNRKKLVTQVKIPMRINNARKKLDPKNRLYGLILTYYD